MHSQYRKRVHVQERSMPKNSTALQAKVAATKWRNAFKEQGDE